MFSYLSTKAIRLSRSNRDKPKILFTTNVLTSIVNILFISTAVLLSYFNVWLGIAIIPLYILYLAKDFIVFVFDIFTMDFTLDSDIFKDLHGM